MRRRLRVFVLWAAAVAAAAAGAASCVSPAAQGRGGGRVEEKMFVTTAHCACGKCCGWERNSDGVPVYSSGTHKGEPKQVGRTASGTIAKHGTVAADPKYPFGTVVHVPGYGYGRVEDRGSGVRGDHLDLFFSDHDRAIQWGRQWKKVKVWLPEKP